MPCSTSSPRRPRAEPRWLAAWLLATSASLADIAHADSYTVTPAPGLEWVSVRACFDGPLPETLRAADGDAARLLRSVRDDGGRPLAWSADGIRTSGAGGRCVHYDSALLASAERGAGLLARWRTRRLDHAVLTDPGLWLWLPPRRPVRLRFVLPPALQVSAPWPLLARDRGSASYRLPARAPDMPASVVIGRLDLRELRLPGGVLRIAAAGSGAPVDAARAERWLDHAARALLTIYGRLPLPSVQVLVLGAGPAREAIPFAQVQRGGATALRFFIDPRRPAAEFLSDWTPIHELSHLLHPLLDDADRWLGEGIASYYQYVARARAGQLSEREAWRGLTAGLARGRAQAGRETLRAASAHMHAQRAYMRVYWSGAAVALLADYRLRRDRAAGRSLDQALARLAACCLPADRVWSGTELVARLDALTGGRVFSSLYQRYAGSRRFPEVAPVLRALGVTVGARGAVTLDDDAPDSPIRHAIMGGRTSTARHGG